MSVESQASKAITLFLGAGASAPFDYAPTKPFLKKFRADSSRDDREFVDDLLSLNHVEDIEHVIEILDSIISHNIRLNEYPMKHMLQKFPMSLRFGDKVVFRRNSTDKRRVRSKIEKRRSWRKLFSLSTELKEAIEERLFDEYESNPEIHEKIVTVYSPLFDLIEKHTKPKNALEVFTTNFDTVIEDYLLKTARYDLVDGFRDSGWNIKEFDKEAGLKRLLRLYKLHGSVDWKERYDEKIRKFPYQRRIKGSRYWKKNIVIYPASKEPPSEEPFESLYRLFRKRIRSKSEVCVVIGFSFRDDYIDNIIAEWMNEVETAKLIVVSSAVKTAIGNLLGREKRLKDVQDDGRIIPIKGKFGNGKTIEMLDSHLKEI